LRNIEIQAWFVGNQNKDWTSACMKLILKDSEAERFKKFALQNSTKTDTLKFILTKEQYRTFEIASNGCIKRYLIVIENRN
jgi:hypothetical protein